MGKGAVEVSKFETGMKKKKKSNCNQVVNGIASETSRSSRLLNGKQLKFLHLFTVKILSKLTDHGAFLIS